VFFDTAADAIWIDAVKKYLYKELEDYSADHSFILHMHDDTYYYDRFEDSTRDPYIFHHISKLRTKSLESIQQ
jgi:hypothetical protein